MINLNKTYPILLLFSFLLSVSLLYNYALADTYSGQGFQQRIGNNTNQSTSFHVPYPPVPSSKPPVPYGTMGCNQPGHAEALTELASAEQSYLDLKAKYYQDWKQLIGSGSYNGTWDEYAKEHLLTSPELDKIKQIHEQYGGLAQYCYPAPQAGRPPSPIPPITSGTLGTQSPSPSINNTSTSTSSTTTDVLMEIEPQTSIPKWIKNNAKWWATGEISDSDFLAGLQYLASQKIIHLAQPMFTNNTSSVGLQPWVKGLAGSWADGKISDDYYKITLQSLVNQNIIKISS